MKIVIVDDDPHSLALLRMVLERKGHAVLAYERAEDCPLFQRQHCPCAIAPPCPDALITDFNMPGANGVEFLRSLYSGPCRNVRTALLTGAELEERDMHRLARYGTRFFTKPVEHDELFAWLDRVAHHEPHTLP